MEHAPIGVPNTPSVYKSVYVMRVTEYRRECINDKRACHHKDREADNTAAYLGDDQGRPRCVITSVVEMRVAHSQRTEVKHK